MAGASPCPPVGPPAVRVAGRGMTSENGVVGDRGQDGLDLERR